MFKKFVGIVVAASVVVLIVLTALGAGSYRSMLPEDLFSAGEVGSAAVSQSGEKDVVEKMELTQESANIEATDSVDVK